MWSKLGSRTSLTVGGGARAYHHPGVGHHAHLVHEQQEDLDQDLALLEDLHEERVEPHQQ